MALQGYLYLNIESVTVDGFNGPVRGDISIGDLTKVSTESKPSGAQFTDVFLMQVPQNPDRLIFATFAGEEKKGECRYDLTPFFAH